MKRVMEMFYSAVIPCAGMGKRMNLGYNKLLYQLNDKTVIENTIDVFLNDNQCKQIILVISKDDEEVIAPYLIDDRMEITYGGKERQDSVYHGLLKVKEEYVLIHDGARPYLKQEAIDRLLEALKVYNACLLMVNAKDTMKRVKDGLVVETLPREEMMNAQTPQAFKTDLILHVHELAQQEHYLGTDDASLVEYFSREPVKVVEGDYSNIKITTIDDIKS